MKTKKPVSRKTIAAMLILLLALFLFVAVKCLPVISAGIRMYRTAMAEESLTERINEVKARPGYTPLADISTEFKHELLAKEDKRFYLHGAIDPIAICRATWENIKAGHIVQGGSTITQQLAKNLCFTFEQTLARKVAELLVAFKLEAMLTKDEIIELYCNAVYFGHDCYGIDNAAEYYFGTEPVYLSARQSGLLVYTLRAPSVYNPAERGVCTDSRLFWAQCG